MWFKMYCIILEDLESSVLVIQTTFIALLWYFWSFLELESQDVIAKEQCEHCSRFI